MRDGEDVRTEWRQVQRFKESGRPKIAKIKAKWCGEEDDDPETLKID